MAFLARSTGWILILVALAVLGYEAMPLLDGGSFKLHAWGELWYRLHPSSLNMYQVAVERHVSAELWDQILAPLLTYKAVFVAAIPGFGLASMPAIIEILRRVVDGQIAT